MRDDCCHSTQISYRMCVWLIAKLLQLGEQLYQNFLIDVVRLGRLMRIKMELVANDASDDRFSVGIYELQENVVSLFFADRQ